jgi:pimeloyl-ACP methyl ester carboxylesterase
MTEKLPIVLVPGLNASARLYAAQIPFLWRHGPVTVADHTRDDSIAGIARRILADAPQRFVLAGLSMGGYVAFEMLRQAGGRIARLALLDTGARADTPEATEKRKVQIEMAESGRFAEIADMQWPLLVHDKHKNDERLKAINRQMAEESGPRAFVNQQRAVMARPDSRPGLAAIKCPTLVLVGDGDVITPPALAEEIAGGIAGSRLVVVPESGHLSTLEQPDAVNAALAEFLK